MPKTNVIPYAVRETLSILACKLGLIEEGWGFQLAQWELQLKEVPYATADESVEPGKGRVAAFFAGGPRLKAQIASQIGHYGQEVWVTAADVRIPFSRKEAGLEFAAGYQGRVERAAEFCRTYTAHQAPIPGTAHIKWVDSTERVNRVGWVRIQLDENAIRCLQFARG